jgi:predicted Zn-dependent protease
MKPALAVLLLGSLACASGGSSRKAGDNYLKYTAFDLPGNERVLLHWSKRKMPLSVYLPAPDPKHFDDPVALLEVVRDGILDWQDVAAPGLPSFEFVDRAADADIPIVWEPSPAGAWFIAQCVYDIDVLTRRYGVERIVITAKRNEHEDASLEDVYLTMLHEMGHALGLLHSPDPGDVMYKGGHWNVLMPELSARDRETLRLLYERPSGRRLTGARSAD